MKTILVLLASVVACAGRSPFQDRPPNVVVIFCDDLGYGDVGCYGAKGYATPNIDRMAAEGMRFTSFCVPQAVCSASRAGILTGCYPNRVGILGALGPKSRIGLHSDEVTIAEVLKPRGYATAIYGKWHLGDDPSFLPTRQGFDEYYGLPYSNDMWPFHPENPRYPPLPLIEQDKVIQENPDQSRLTTDYTERAVRFIECHKDRLFFVYLAHAMVHVPLFVSDKFKGKSEGGLFGDVMMEVDGSVGRILDALKRLGLDERTLVVFTGDNGPWLSYGDHAGSAGPFREGKGTTFEGGVREPGIFRWPGRIPAGAVCNELALTLDLLPTLTAYAGASAPSDRIIDGKDIRPLLEGNPGAKSPHEAFYYYWGNELQAVRSGNWKLHFPHGYRTLEAGGGKGGKPSRYSQRKIELSLFELDADPGETADVAGKHPEVVERLKTLAEQAREDLGDSAQKRAGKNVRPAGRL
jgi:arylsulfatase A-like enzyme